MATESQIQQLEAKHRALDEQLDELMAHPSTSDTEIADMKRQKLHLKDKISMLRNKASQH